MTNLKRPCFWALFVAVALVGGCKKKEAAPPSPDPGTAEAGPAAPASPSGGVPMPPPKPAVVQPGADQNATLSQLALELRKYVMRTRSVPKTFEEFIAKSGVQAPAPPAGKKYAIRGQEVVLVNR